MIRNLMRGTALASALVLPLFSSAATAQIAVSANDNKVILVDGVQTVPPTVAPDTVMVLDLGVSPPKVLAELQAPSSVVGVPQSVAVAKDESYALVTGAMKIAHSGMPLSPAPNAEASRKTGTRTISETIAERTPATLPF